MDYFLTFLAGVFVGGFTMAVLFSAYEMQYNDVDNGDQE